MFNIYIFPTEVILMLLHDLKKQMLLWLKKKIGSFNKI
jgi:hypothetical protein